MRHANGLTRREFFRTGALAAGAAGLALTRPTAAAPIPTPPDDRRCILLFLTGGPSQLDTWDPKPDAPADIRGPFRSIATRVPGLRFTELFPRMAERADRFAVIRSLHHDEAPIHETGQQLVQTGRLFRGGRKHPHYGAALSRLLGPTDAGAPAWAVLPGPLGDTGVAVSHGQTAGPLGPAHAPAYDTGRSLAAESPWLIERYGLHNFGRNCLRARQLVEAGVRLVTVNMFSTVYDSVSWDCHADGGALATDLGDYRDTVGPTFDQAFSALFDDLRDRGLLDTTLVLATGEFGRTPHPNPRGGRDHWPGVWSALVAGCGVRGGAIVGASDAIGAEPADRPVTPAELAATVYHALGLDPRWTVCGRPLADATPIRELF
jgi:uncharacterized protein (DUF1501 family)